MKLDTSTPEARAQYDANVAFALNYKPRSAPGASRPRVLVTGFGRFLEHAVNATGMIASALLPDARYPETARAAQGAVDPPEPQTRVTLGTIELPRSGAVDVCAMVLPVYWDLAAILAIREIDAFGPELVLMNGIAGPEQDLWIELGTSNRAKSLRDGSDLLSPVIPSGERFAPIVSSKAKRDATRPLFLSWNAVRDAARDEIARQSTVSESGRAFGEIVRGAKLAGFAREGNAYLCNNLAYAVNYAMTYADREVTLLEASATRRGSANRVTVKLARDLRGVARAFVHWPSRIAGAHLGAAASVMRAMIDAQLWAAREGAPPTSGSNDRAEISASGSTF